MIKTTNSQMTKMTNSQFREFYNKLLEALRAECDEMVRNGECSQEYADFRYDMKKDEILFETEFYIEIVPDDEIDNNDDDDYNRLFDDYEHYDVVDASIVTNFQADELPRYQKAIELSKSKDLYITNDAVYVWGNPLHDCMVLRRRNNGNLTLFWRMFESLKEE